MNVKKISIGSIVIIAVFFGAIMWVTQPMATLADDYFVLLSQSEIEQAYQLMSYEFKTNITLTEFREVDEIPILKKNKASTWTSRTIEGDTANIEGVIKTFDPTTPKINATMDFVKEDGQWKIYSFEM